MINWNDFEKIDMRVGTIISANVFPKAKKPAYQLTIDFGPLGLRSSSAQITELYSIDELAGRQVIAVVNFPPRQIADFSSECLVLGIYSSAGVVLLQPGQTVQNGDKVG
jgi:tRNA-binding protein